MFRVRDLVNCCCCQGELLGLLDPQNRDDLYVENHPQKRSYRLAYYHPLWVGGVLISGHNIVAAAAVYQIPNTEHMAYRLVRTLVYKRGVGIRETVW